MEPDFKLCKYDEKKGNAGMKAVIMIDVPQWQIGQEVSVYFPDTMVKHAKCEAVKMRPRPERLLPCKCGCKRREHWYGSTEERSEILKCYRCGFEVAGKNEIDVHKKWNEAITASKEDKME